MEHVPKCGGSSGSIGISERTVDWCDGEAHMASLRLKHPHCTQMYLGFLGVRLSEDEPTPQKDLHWAVLILSGISSPGRIDFSEIFINPRKVFLK
jgi:hypothetical protein